MNPDAFEIIRSAIIAADPYQNVADALKKQEYGANLTVIAVGKAACTMARAAYDVLGDKIRDGYALTKYGHSTPLPEIFSVRESGHPLPDENSVKYTEEIIAKVKGLTKKDRLIFLLSGGASAIFESPRVSLSELRRITDGLMKSGANITQINTIRKKLSKVKGGKFADMCGCEIDCIVLSDVLGDRLDVIASGPCCSDSSNPHDVIEIIEKYPQVFETNSDETRQTNRILHDDMQAEVTNVRSIIAGSIEMLCKGAAKCAEKLGYEVYTVTSSMTGEARQKGAEIAQHAIGFAKKPHKPTVFLYGGETTVTVKGNGKGGRNQEIALASAIELRNHENITVLSVGSDGTDGPTDAAGGIADGETYGKMTAKHIDPMRYLDNNDSYHALDAAGCLIKTGPTGTNVNDITITIIK